MEPVEPIKPVSAARRPRRRPRTPNPEVRTRLLVAAGELMNEEGFGGLRVDQIAERAGLSVGTFYLYFDGKADLFVSLVVELTGRLRERMRGAYDAGGTARERLERALEAYLDFVEANTKGFLYFRDAGTIHTTVGSLHNWAFAQHADDLRPVLEDGMANGELRDADAELLAQALVGLMQHLAGFWIENRDTYTRDDVKGLLTSLGMRGLLP